MAVKRVMEHAVPRVSQFECFKFQVMRIQWFRRIVYYCAACVDRSLFLFQGRYAPEMEILLTEHCHFTSAKTTELVSTPHVKPRTSPASLSIQSNLMARASDVNLEREKHQTRVCRCPSKQPNGKSVQR